MRLQIRNATVELGANTVLEKVNFEIHDKEKIAIVGRNGCGKTTLLRLISGDVEPNNPDSDESFLFMKAGGQQIGFLKQVNFRDPVISARDEIRKVLEPVYACERRMREIEEYLAEAGRQAKEHDAGHDSEHDTGHDSEHDTGHDNGHDSKHDTGHDTGRDIGHDSRRDGGHAVSSGEQTADLQTQMQKVLNEYASLQKQYAAMGGHDAEREMEIMFQQFGFSMQDLDKPMGTFSGGQQTKIAFIKLLLSKPDILLLDEPTNHLDLPTIEWLENYLKNYSKAVVVVSHDRVFLDNVVSVTYEIEYHRIKRYAGNYTAFVRQKEEALLKQEKDYEAQQKEIRRLTEWIEKWKNTPTKVASAHSKERAIAHMVLVEKPRRFDTTTFKAHFSPRISSYSDVLDVRNLSIGYDHELSRVTFHMMRGDRLAITGQNGKGKSTLLKTLMGLVPALDGTFKIGTNVEIGYYDQQKAVINHEDPEQTVLDNFWDTYPRLTNEEVRSTLGAFAFSQEEVERKLGQLSGGEKVRLALCKMFYTRPNFLILDEPTNHMDILGKESLEKMLSSFEGTVLFVSHDRYFINRIATGILQIGEDGSCTLYAADPAADGKQDADGGQSSSNIRSAGSRGSSGTYAASALSSASNMRSAGVQPSGMYPSSGTHSSNMRSGGAQASSGTHSGAGVRPGDDIASAAAGLSKEDRERIQNPGKIRSRLERKIEKLQDKISESDQLLHDLKQQQADPGLATNYEQLMKLQHQIEEIENTQEEILVQILEAEEELEKL